MFLTVKRESEKQKVIADLKKTFGDDGINYIELLRERKEPPKFTFSSDKMAVEPCGGMSGEEPCVISSADISGGISLSCHNNPSPAPPTQDELFKENCQSQPSGTLTMFCTSEKSDLFALTCYHVGCTDDRVRDMDNKNVDITELYRYYTEDAKSNYSLAKRNEYFYHKRSEKVSKVETDDSDSGTSPAIDDPHEGLVDKYFDLGNSMQANEESDDIDRSWSSGGYSSNSENDEQSMNDNDGHNRDDNDEQSMNDNDGHNRDDNDEQNRDDNDGQNRDDNDGQNRDDNDGQNRDDNDGQNREDNDGQNRDDNDGQNKRIFIGKYCQGFFDKESDILSIRITNEDVNLDSSKFDVKFSAKNQEELHAKFNSLMESGMGVTVQKTGYATNRTTGRLLHHSYSHRDPKSSKLLFKNMYVVVKGEEVPFFVSADSGALVSWVDSNNIKHGFAYAVCEVDEINLPRQWSPAKCDSEALEDKSEDKSNDISFEWSDDDDDDAIAKDGPYYLCHDIFTALKKLKQNPVSLEKANCTKTLSQIEID